MSLDKDTVRQIAFLSRIKVPEEALEHLAGELNNIIGWVEQLEQVDTANVEPMASVAEMSWPKREDKVSDGNYPDRVLANGPDVEDGCYAVPKVVE